MNDERLENLKQKNIEILKAEIGALLFNLGKTHVGFSGWRKHFCTVENNFTEEDFIEEYGYKTFTRYKGYYTIKNQNKETPFKIDLKSIDDKLLEFFNVKINLNKFEDTKIVNIIYGNAIETIAKEENINNDVIELVNGIFFRGCENINSGIDKGQPPESQQLRTPWISNAFGSFKEDVSFYMLDRQRICFFNKLANKINRLNEEIKDFSEDDWIELRNFIVNEIKNWYSHLLSDSRFPINDVTLWDQAYMTASLFKASLAAMILEDSKIKEYKENHQKIKWSILGVQYDKLGLAEKVLKPYFVDWYRVAVKKIDAKIKEIVEIDYALGNEIYRDETGIYFIVPENIGEKSGDGYNLELSADFCELKEKIVNAFKEIELDEDKHEIFESEFMPSIFVTKPSRGTMNIAYLLDNSRSNFLKSIYSKAFIDRCKKESNNSENYDGLCQICRLKLGKKKEDFVICDQCDKRRISRLHNWIENINGETIWTGDLQDKNGRIALVTVKFELKEWLNGNMLNTILAIIDDWNSKKEELEKNLRIKKGNVLNKTMLKNLISTEGIEYTLQNYTDILLTERTIGDRWEKFMKNKLENNINFNENKIEWKQLKNNQQHYKDIAEILLQFLLRKNPSPARFRRIWETTEEFFIEIKNDLKKLIGIEDWRAKRIVWENVVNDERYKSKEYTYKGLDFWVNEKGDVYLISSIEQAIPIIGNIKEKDSFEKITEKIKEDKKDWIKEFTLEEYDTKKATNIKLNNSKVKYESYLPYLSIIDPTPISWQFIIPAEYLPNIIDKIQEKYKKNFKYVVGKLPLHIGVVIQDYKKPLYIGLKALRKIRRDITSWEDIRKEVDYQNFKRIQRKYLENGNSKETNNPQNYYSLYPLKIKNETNEKEYSNTYEFYIQPDKEMKRKLILVDGMLDSQNEDYKGIELEIYPNTIDFEFLDTNIRRNDIYYKDGKRILEEKSNRPYTWEEWENFKRFKDYFFDEKDTKKQKINKLNNMVSLIYSKTKDWEGNDESLKKLMLSAFVNTFELNGKDERTGQEKRDCFARLFGEGMTWEKLETMHEDEFNKLLWKFIDMYEFWHKALKKF